MLHRETSKFSRCLYFRESNSSQEMGIQWQQLSFNFPQSWARKSWKFLPVSGRGTLGNEPQAVGPDKTRCLQHCRTRVICYHGNSADEVCLGWNVRVHSL